MLLETRVCLHFIKIDCVNVGLEAGDENQKSNNTDICWLTSAKVGH